MRELTSHKVNEVNDGLKVVAIDGPGPGNASHEYRIEWNPNGQACAACDIRFQNGPIKEVGVNGITNEALLAIVQDRLEGFQGGKYACDENESALQSVRLAMRALKQRTQARVTRGVEGTMAV